ncbi:MAG: hypothetical protein V3T14_00255 [Myxococcota bacterium]
MILNDALLHLIVNHVPILGSALSVLLLLIALWLRNDPGALLAATLVMMLTGIGAFISAETGHNAEQFVEELSGFAEKRIEEHEERADIAMPMAVIAGIGALVVLVLGWQRAGPIPVTWLIGLLAASLLTTAAMGWTAAAGGVIRHTEIRAP